MSKNLEKFLTKIYSDSDNIPSLEVKYPDAIPLPTPSLNWALGGGIYPGSFVCFEGPESSGKSFMALTAVAEMLKLNPEAVAIWFDCENTFSDHWAKLLLPDEADRRRLIVRRKSPMTGKEIFDYFRDTILGMIQDGLEVVVCVVDSIQMIIPPKESNLKSTEDHVMGDLSGYLPKALRLISGPSKPRLKEGFKGITWLFISQVRDNMDPSAAYTGKKYVRSGGRAFGHALDVEVLFEIIGKKDSRLYDDTVKNSNDTFVQVGHRVRAKIEKNKLGPPYRVAEFDLLYNEGIVNQVYEVASLGMKLGFLTKEGNTYYFNSEKIAVGQDATVTAIAENEKLYTEIYDKIKSTYNDVAKT